MIDFDRFTGKIKGYRFDAPTYLSYSDFLEALLDDFNQQNRQFVEKHRRERAGPHDQTPLNRMEMCEA